MSHVFLSYAHLDESFIDILEPLIEEKGITVWTDRELLAGENWRQAIDQSIQRCFALLVVMTPEARLSEYVTYEWSYALGVGITVIPLMLRQTPLHPKLEELQYLDFMGEIDASLAKLQKRLSTLEVDHLMKSLRHPQYKARHQAIQRVGERKVKKAVPDLIRALKYDRSAKVIRPAAAAALAQIGTPEALEALGQKQDP
jgi:hypothetical protein